MAGATGLQEEKASVPTSNLNRLAEKLAPLTATPVPTQGEALTRTEVRAQARRLSTVISEELAKKESEKEALLRKASMTEREPIQIVDDCEVDIPVDSSIGRVHVSIVLSGLDAAPAVSSGAVSGSASPAPPATNAVEEKQGPPDKKLPTTATATSGQDPVNWTDFMPQPAQLRTSVDFFVDHGYYYYDVGVMLAAAPRGDRKISSSSEGRLATTEKTAQRTLVQLSVWPWGHRRGVSSPWSGGPTTKRSFADMMHFSLGLKGTLDASDQEIFLGAGLELVTGFSIQGGYAFINGQGLRPGYFNGSATPADPASAIENKLYGHFYLGVGIGFEIAHTLAPRTFGSDSKDKK